MDLIRFTALVYSPPFPRGSNGTGIGRRPMKCGGGGGGIPRAIAIRFMGGTPAHVTSAHNVHVHGYNVYTYS